MFTPRIRPPEIRQTRSCCWHLIDQFIPEPGFATPDAEQADLAPVDYGA